MAAGRAAGRWPVARWPLAGWPDGRMAGWPVAGWPVAAGRWTGRWPVYGPLDGPVGLGTRDGGTRAGGRWPVAGCYQVAGTVAGGRDRGRWHGVLDRVFRLSKLLFLHKLHIPILWARLSGFRLCLSGHFRFFLPLNRPPPPSKICRQKSAVKNPDKGRKMFDPWPTWPI